MEEPFKVEETIHSSIFFFCVLAKDFRYSIWRERTSVQLPEHQLPVRTQSNSQCLRINSTDLERRDLSSSLTPLQIS